MSQQPFEIIGNPAQIYLAAVGTAFPAIGAVPAAGWTLLGKLGNRNTSNDGVKVKHSQKVAYIRPDGATGPVKAFRSEEDLSLEITLWDMTLEAYTYALNGTVPSAVAAASGIAGAVSLAFGRGSDVQQFAALCRGPSPYGDGWYMQYEVPVVVQSGDAEPVFKKAVPSGLKLLWMAMEDPTQTGLNRFGVLRAQKAAALP